MTENKFLLNNLMKEIIAKKFLDRQTEFAKKVEMSKSHINAYYNYRRVLGWSTFMLMCQKSAIKYELKLEI